jgi:hypothetical protein
LYHSVLPNGYIPPDHPFYKWEIIDLQEEKSVRQDSEQFIGNLPPGS